MSASCTVHCAQIKRIKFKRESSVRYFKSSHYQHWHKIPNIMYSYVWLHGPNNVHKYKRAASNPNHFSRFPFIFILLRHYLGCCCHCHCFYTIQVTMQLNIETSNKFMYLAPIFQSYAAFSIWQQIENINTAYTCI